MTVTTAEFDRIYHGSLLNKSRPANVISAIKKRRPEARAIILTGYGNIATAVNAVKLGAVDFLAKPVDADDVAAALLAIDHKKVRPPENPTSADRVRWEHIQRIYELCGRNVSETARRLNMLPRASCGVERATPAFAVVDMRLGDGHGLGAKPRPSIARARRCRKGLSSSTISSERSGTVPAVRVMASVGTLHARAARVPGRVQSGKRALALCIRKLRSGGGGESGETPRIDSPSCGFCCLVCQWNGPREARP